ncbi:haloacid dehalogenase type II [Streptosporangium sp. LJ11]|uniref:haloacid dehalogenase type II n=1 Tax=Streptosporangium sp. LJ11 TaxID=3436927 RepID=UPI003F7A8ED6
MTRVVAFDVNETLLDLRALDAAFEELLGSAELRGPWFAQVLQLSFVGGLTGEYVDFSTAQHAALSMLAERHGRGLTSDDITGIVNRMSSLPAHPEVAGALRRLRSTSLAVVALTNSPATVAEAQLVNSGIRDHFDGVISADSVKRLKPAGEPYLAVAKAFDVDIAEVRLVAAHWWDTAGALATGCKAAFVARPGMVLNPIGPRPDIVGADLDAVVDQIMALDA